MEISFIRKTDNNHIISCLRNDGTITWKHTSSFFILHDLCHFAVEKEPELKKAFYGMLASGTAISDFDIPSGKRTVEFSKESVFVEQLVNLLMIENSQGKFDGLIQMLEGICIKEKLTDVPVLTLAKLDAILNTFKALQVQWNMLKENQTMKVFFQD